MSDLIIKHAGSTQTATDTTNYNNGAVIRVTPTVSATAYDSRDVLFLTTEIPNAVRNRGGVSKLIGISVIDEADQGKDVELVFMQVSTNLIGAISPGSSGGVALSDANTAKILACVNINFSDNLCDLINLRMTTLAGSDNNQYDGPMPILLQAEPNSTSVYFAGIAGEATDLAAVDDLTFIFHIEYL